MAKVVTIQSNINITVTPGLSGKDVTNPDAHIGDRLRVSALWCMATVDIKAGQHQYPAEIAEWATVRALEKDKLLTVGAITDSDEPEVTQISKDLERNLDTIEKQVNVGTKPKKTTKKTAPKTETTGTLADLAK